MSRLIKGGNSPVFSIGSFEEERVEERLSPSRSRVMTSNAKPAPVQDASVSCWDFPLVDKMEEDPEKREDFKTRIARLEKEAYEKGFEQGQRDGLALEKSKMEEIEKQLTTLFEGLRDLKTQIYSESEGEILKLVIIVARKLIGEEIRMNSRIIGNTIRSALSFITDRRRVKIIISPDDMEEVRRILPDLSKLTKGGFFQLVEDNAIERGGCVLETGFGRINATIEDQLDVLEEEIENQFHSSMGAAGATLP